MVVAWALALDDRMVTVWPQRRCMGNLGGVQDEIEVPTCQNSVISRPSALAAVVTGYP